MNFATIFLSLSHFSYLYFFLLSWEFLFRAPRPVRQVSLWWPKITLLFAMRFAAGLMVAPLLPIAISLMRGAGGRAVSSWGLGLAMSFLAFTFLHYWIHRLWHHVKPLWRWAHQMHHVPSRFDLSLTLYVHPLQVLTIQSVFLVVAAIGTDIRYLWIFAFLKSSLEYMQHMHIRTPRWLGYLIIRPEQHSLHHSTHDINYGMISLWDILFGTFRNCDEEANTVGLGKTAESQFWACLFFQEV